MESLTEALARMAAIEGRLQAVESVETATSSVTGGGGAEVNKILAQYQLQLLVRLKDIRNAMEASGGDVVSITAERDAAVAENVRLKKEMERMNYRISHLVKELSAEEAKNQ